MRRLGIVALLAACSLSQAACAQQNWLFAYFKEPGNQGIYLALSRDGYHYTALNDGGPWLAPEQPGEIMRDVYLTRGPDGLFQMVWTWAWHGNALGHATSRDLIHWSVQQYIPIMASHQDTNNVWAPELAWDEQRGKWLVLWSSSSKDDARGNRIWCSYTSDFNDFTPPQIFFDPGFVVIDATLFHAANKTRSSYYLILKDQTNDPLRYQERFATGPTVEGPWSPLSPPINESWSEGPSAIQIGDTYLVFYDHYRPPHAQYEAVATKDWKHWTDASAQISMPAASKHGSFLQITDEEANRLLSRHDAGAQPKAGAPSP
ncbi:MAG: glycoside hydrolase family 43 protein [Acidobacteriota bacterium]|nr:glycoside hydrolase family 43 protein [Acidobacteriota bacterium]